jgi:hypothetical protein
MAKVLLPPLPLVGPLASASHPRQRVGFICTTHLQAAEGKDPIRVWQMDSIHRWIDDFVKVGVCVRACVLVCACMSNRL